MKKITLFLIFFFSIATQAALPTGAGEFQVNVPLFNGNWEFGAAAYYLKPSFPQVDYVILFPTVDSEDGHFKSVRPKYKFGYELYLGYLIGCTGNDVRLSYNNYDETSHDHTGQHEGLALPTLTDLVSASVPVPSILAEINFGFFSIAAQLFGPNTVPVTGTVQEASVQDAMRVNNLDFDVGQYINVDTFFRIRLFTGLRYSRLKHNLVADYIVGNFTGTETQEIGPIIPGVSLISTLTLTGISQIEENINETSRFNGLGPRLGMEGIFHLGGGFGLVGRLATAALIGRETDGIRRIISGDIVTQISSITTVPTSPIFVSITLTDPPVGTVLEGVPVSRVDTLTFDKATRVVPNIEAKIGLNYTTQFSNSCRIFTLELGYYVNHYFNAVNIISLADTLQTSINTMDVSFSGPYLDLCFTL